MDSAIVADVVLLSGMFFERHQDLIRSRFGSVDVPGGADLDMIIDGCLFDFKTTLKPKVTTEALRQLVLALGLRKQISDRDGRRVASSPG